MKNWLHVTPERAPSPPQRERLTGNTLPLFLALSALLIWTPLRTQAQVIFAISTVPNQSVLVGTPVSIQLLVTNNTGASSALIWTLSSTPTTDASLNPLSTGPVGPTTFSWTPTQAQVVTFAVSVSQQNTLNQTNTLFTITVTNSGPSTTSPVVGPIASQTVTAGGQLQLSLYATNTDNTTNQLTFQLTSTPATSAAITNGTMSVVTTSTTTNGVFQGIFTWATTSDDSGLYTMGVSALEAAMGTQSATQSFGVNVILNTDCPQYLDFQTAVEEGGVALLTNCPVLVVSNTVVITNDVTIVAETN